MADFIASSLEKPFCMALQYFFEKLFEILFCRRLELGSDVFKADTIVGFNKRNKDKRIPKNKFNKAIAQIIFIIDLL